MFNKLNAMLTELNDAKSNKTKVKQLLQVYTSDKDFRWMVTNTLSQGHSFGIDNLPPFEQAETSSDTAMIECIETLKKGAGVTRDTISKVHSLMCSSQERYNVVTRILRKDLRCGVAAKTINKVSPNLIFRCPYQRCASADFLHKMSYKPGAILQKKANGQFAYLLPDGTFMTRKGETSKIEGNPVAPYVADLPGLNDKVLAVELTVLDEEGKTLPRAVGNGLINSFYKGGGDPAAAKRIRAHTWLYLTPEEFRVGRGQTPYRYLWDKLTQMIPVLGSPIQPIESWYVKSLEEAMTKTKQLIAVGEEGTVLKSMAEDFFWADEDPSYYQVKLKAEAECEFKIIGAYQGDQNKKYAGMLGGIRVCSKDVLIVSDVGSGFTDEQRKLGVQSWLDRAGEIVTVKFNGITKPNEDGIRSLDHPRLIEVRDDKEEADTYETCYNTLMGIVE